MVASHSTIENVVKVVRKHVDATTFAKIVNELENVDGNTSFRETVQRLVEKVKK